MNRDDLMDLRAPRAWIFLKGGVADLRGRAGGGARWTGITHTASSPSEVILLLSIFLSIQNRTLLFYRLIGIQIVSCFFAFLSALIPTGGQFRIWNLSILRYFLVQEVNIRRASMGEITSHLCSRHTNPTPLHS